MLHNQQFSALQESHSLSNLALIFSKTWICNFDMVSDLKIFKNRRPMKINCTANNFDDELCTISAHHLIPKLIHFLKWQTNLNAGAIFNYLKSRSSKRVLLGWTIISVTLFLFSWGKLWKLLEYLVVGGI